MYIIYRNALILIYKVCIAQTGTSLIQTLILLQQPQKKEKEMHDQPLSGSFCKK